MDTPPNPFSIMHSVAFLVLGRHDHRELCLERVIAEEHAARHHGVVIELVRRDEVEELIAWRRWIGAGSRWKSL